MEPFKYPPSGLPAVRRWVGIPLLGSEVGAAVVADAAVEAICEAPDTTEQAFEEGRVKGIEEGRLLERSEQLQRIEQIEKNRIETAARLHEEFALEKEKFLHEVEPELVKLSLRIAERILRRELQADPLMLTGSIRTALGQLADRTKVRLRVPADDAELWAETVACLPRLRVRPEIVADGELQAGECSLESESGSVDLSVRSQLQEIARDFFREMERPSAPHEAERQFA